ncbi:uncharacterized protein LOC117109563 [Anneissia japonica]|uniref:uncharacterized protein LOC117109563 n=1 Tax=Anneissia japonica TaxID=1529436 RepID=UPI001425AA52|nr:uncharacterized protein LOC117109563 [Anneissia japonica]
MLRSFIEEIQPNTFAGLKNLNFLEIRENNLNVIKENTFALHGSSPCQIFITKANVREIATRSFKNLGHSSFVLFDHNLITNIPSRSFNGSKFISISLEFNRLQHIHPEAFIEVESLWELSLSNNLFTEIPLAVYSSKVVRSIFLNVNSINLSSEHNRSVIAYTTKAMFIVKNNIRSISRHHFSGLETLEALYLHLNNISYIEDGSFSGTSLKYLILYGNSLKKITSEMFNVNGRTLRYLYLFNNLIEVVEYEAYSHLAPNSTVYLECGALEYIPPKISENITARCVSNKTTMTLVSYYVELHTVWYGMRCDGRVCTLCAQGYYGLLTKEGCYPCPPGGYYQDRLGYVENGNYKSDCKQCPIGTFSPRYGSASIFDCRSCPPGTNTDANAALDACPCLENFHRTYRYGACEPCISGADCTGGFQKLKAGYWWSWNFTGYVGPDDLGSLNEYKQFVENISNSFFEPSNPESLKDTVYTGSIPAVHMCPRSESCQGGDIEANCSEGYTAWFCAECSPKYYKLFNDCHKCQDIKIIIIVITFLYGYVENGNYKSDCKQCPIGTFSPRYGSASIFDCRSCPPGTNTDANAALDACPCLENFHRTYRYGACEPCISGADCTGGFQKLKAGYWWSWNFTGYVGPDDLGSLNEYKQFVENISNSFFEPSNPESLKDTVYTGSIPAVHMCPRSESCQGGDIEANCSEGYTAWFCAECSPKYYKLFNDCHKCQDIKIIIIVMIFLILTFVCVTYGLWRLDKRIRGGITRDDKFVNHLKIAVNFYQVLGILSEVNEIHWPDSFQPVGQSLQYLDIVRYVNILSPTCIFPGVWNAYTFLYIAIATPFIIVVSASFIFLLCYIYKRYKQAHLSHHLTDNFILITMVLLYLTYANACSKIMAVGPWSVRTFNVTADGKYSKRVLTSDYSIDIDEESGLKYETNKNIVYASFVYVIGFPIVLILVIYYRYKRHEAVRCEEQRGTTGIKFFCKQYRPKCWFWEIIDMYNKAILALIVNFKDDQASNMSYSLFLTVILIALHLYLEPVKAKSDQRFQLLTLVFIVVNLSVGAIVDIESEYTVDETILFLHGSIPFILLLLNLSILFAVFFDLLIKVKEVLWWESHDSHELRNDAGDVDDNGDGENELSAILQPDFESLSVYNPTIHN